MGIGEAGLQDSENSIEIGMISRSLSKPNKIRLRNSLLANIAFVEIDPAVPVEFALLRVDIVYDSTTSIPGVIQYVIVVVVVVGGGENRHFNINILPHDVSFVPLGGQGIGFDLPFVLEDTTVSARI